MTPNSNLANKKTQRMLFNQSLFDEVMLLSSMLMIELAEQIASFIVMITAGNDCQITMYALAENITYMHLVISDNQKNVNEGFLTFQN